jgi:hypothetical protein
MLSMRAATLLRPTQLQLVSHVSPLLLLLLLLLRQVE